MISKNMLGSTFLLLIDPKLSFFHRSITYISENDVDACLNENSKYFENKELQIFHDSVGNSFSAI